MKLSRRSLLGALAAPLPAASADEPVVTGDGPLEASCATFDATPPAGTPSPALGENPVLREGQGRLFCSVFALRQGGLAIAGGSGDFTSADFDAIRGRLARGLGIPLDRTFFGVTHNHSAPADSAWKDLRPGRWADIFYRDLDAAVARLPKGFVPVDAAWGAGEEKTIVYNQKGRRPDGTSYFMREEDRVKIPGDFVGVIDPTASVVRFNRKNGQPLLLMTHFTGHPVVSFLLEEPVVNPDFSGWAVQDLVNSFPEPRPIGLFLQGCAGDINSKRMFGGEKPAREAGRHLGKVFIEASRHARRIARPRLALARGTAEVPFGPLPSLEILYQERKTLLDFQRRAEAGDPNTLQVLGYNFSVTMKMGYRRNLAAPLLRWTDWAIEQQKKGNAQPKQSWPVPMQVAALGEIAWVLMTSEPFARIGLRIRERSPFPLTIPAAYCNSVAPGYIGTAEDVGDGDYYSAHYRYAMNPPFRKPAGDVIVDKAVELLAKVHSAIQR